MKLLPKSEVDLKKAQERKGEIDEGLKLAKKIDALRQAVVEEERKLTLFRRASLETIQKEIDDLLNEKMILEESVIRLTKEVQRLQLAIQSVRNY